VAQAGTRGEKGFRRVMAHLSFDQPPGAGRG
jgi:hypothetical protein